MSEWPLAKIGEIAERVAMGPFGSSIKVSTFVSRGVPVISGQHLREARLTDSEFNYVSEEHAAQLAKANVQRGDVILTHAGSIGQVAVIPETSRYERYVISQRQFYIRCDRSKVLPEFLTYYLRSSEGQHKVLANSNQTGVPSIAQPVSYIRTVEVPVPTLGEQRAIANVLGALDDKIESNRRIWKTTLQLISVARANAASVEVTHLKSLGQLVDFNLNTTRPGPSEDKIVYIDIASVTPGSIEKRQVVTWSDAPSRARREVRDGDLIFSTVRPGRRSFAVILNPDAQTVVSTGFAVMTPKYCGTSFLAAVIADEEFADYCETVAQGSAYPAVSPESMSRFEVEVPSVEVLNKFESMYLPILRRGDRAQAENVILSNMRDALLPELLSGRLRVPDSKRFVEAAI